MFDWAGEVYGDISVQIAEIQLLLSDRCGWGMHGDDVILVSWNRLLVMELEWKGGEGEGTGMGLRNRRWKMENPDHRIAGCG